MEKGERLVVLYTGEIDIDWLLQTLSESGLPNLWIPKKDSFYQVEEYITRNRKGLGLGLTLAKKIVEMHKGHILLKRAAEEGTECIISFPLSSNATDFKISQSRIV